MNAVLAAAERLRDAARTGELAGLCRRHGVRLFVVFGSAVKGAAQPRDLDIAVSFERGITSDVLALVGDLTDLTGIDTVDLLDLDRAGPVVRERALVATLPLYESEQGVFARMQMAAMTQRMDTEWLRQLDLELMAGGGARS